MNFAARDLKGPSGTVFVDHAKQLGRGATAVVKSASMNGQKYAAKIFHEDRSFPAAKIVAMLANPPTGAIDQSGVIVKDSLAWPVAILSDGKGQDIGFLMPELDLKRAFPLDYFYDPILFKKLNSPTEAALSFKVEIGRNLSRVIADLHRHGHYFVDMKPQNIRVNLGSHEVCLLDCDGFSIAGPSEPIHITCPKCGATSRVPTARLSEGPKCGKCAQKLLTTGAGMASGVNIGTRFPAELLSTDYISPEAFRGNTPPTALGEAQDRYALAVLLFQLFNRGTHPFQGIPLDPSIDAATNDEKAARGLYPHGRSPHLLVKPRPHSIHAHFDERLRLLFDKAFLGDSTTRPSAKDWENTLSELLSSKSLVRCANHPGEFSHIRFKDMQCPACYLSSVPSVQVPKKTISGTPLPHYSASSVAGSRGPDDGFGFAIVMAIIFFIVVFMVIVANGSNRQSAVEAPAASPTELSYTGLENGSSNCELHVRYLTVTDLCSRYWSSPTRQTCDLEIKNELERRGLSSDRDSCGTPKDTANTAGAPESTAGGVAAQASGNSNDMPEQSSREPETKSGSISLDERSTFIVSGESLIRTIANGGLRETETSEYEVTLPISSPEVVFRGVCDSECSDLDLMVAEIGSGRPIVYDNAPDANPALAIRTSVNQSKVKIRVIMAKCSTGSCNFAVRMFSRGLTGTTQSQSLPVTSIPTPRGAPGETFVSLAARGELGNEEEFSWLIPLPVGSGLVFRGTCGSYCTDLDLSVSDNAGKIIGTDYASDAIPAVAVQTVGLASASATLRVKMSKCGSSKCAYQVYLFSR